MNRLCFINFFFLIVISEINIKCACFSGTNIRQQSALPKFEHMAFECLTSQHPVLRPFFSTIKALLKWKVFAINKKRVAGLGSWTISEFLWVVK